MIIKKEYHKAVKEQLKAYRNNECVAERIIRTLEGLSELEAAIIIYKYIDKKTWNEVSFITGYSKGHCKRICSKAIDKMAIGLYGFIAIEGGI